MRDTGYEAAMRRALELAARGPARGINPRVGCVILAPSGDVIAEGWHRGAGTPHAETDALSALDAHEARGATAVVSLEPCNHTGHTGPCASALIDAGVARVVYAVADPGQHSGGGADRLAAAGIEVVSGVLAAEATAFLYDWLTAARLGRPFVSLKWASSLDGRVAANDGSSRWITGEKARERVHEQREAADAIVVGIGTVIADDPALTARDCTGELLAEQPLPVVVGHRPLPAHAAVLRHPKEPLIYREHDVRGLLVTLRERGIRRVFVEGGPTLASAFVRSGFVDEYLVYLAPLLLGGNNLALHDIGVSSIGEAQRLRPVSLRQLDRDLLVVAVPESGSGTPITDACPSPPRTSPGSASPLNMSPINTSPINTSPINTEEA